MALKAPIGNNTNRVAQPTLEPATYPARIVRILDYGLQPQSFNGEQKAPAQVISITYELLDVFMVDEQGKELEDKPRWISEEFPLHPMSSDRARSTQRYSALDPENKFEGDWTRLITFPCMVTVAVNKKGDKTYENVSNVSTMRARDVDKAAELKNPSSVFLLDDPDMALFNKLPKWIQEKIQSNLNYAGSPLEAALKGKAPEKKQEVKKPPKEEPAEASDEEDVPW